MGSCQGLFWRDYGRHCLPAVPVERHLFLTGKGLQVPDQFKRLPVLVDRPRLVLGAGYIQSDHLAAADAGHLHRDPLVDVSDL